MSGENGERGGGEDVERLLLKAYLCYKLICGKYIEVGPVCFIPL